MDASVGGAELELKLKSQKEKKRKSKFYLCLIFISVQYLHCGLSAVLFNMYIFL